MPQSLIVVGGGAVGAELALVFARFGAAVTVIEALPRLLPFEEPEASALIERIFTREGVNRSVLIGATSAGPTGGDVLSLLQLAVRAEVPVATLRNMPCAYPTFYRAIEDALRDLESS